MAAQKKKGVQYIAQKLVKYFPRKFSSYKESLPEAKRVLAQIQDDDDGRVNLKTIFSKVRTPRKAKKEIPILEGQMGEPIDFFMFGDYENWIIECQDNLLLTSKIIPSNVPQPLKGGQIYGYNEFFAPFVNYVNSIQQRTESETGKKDTSGTYFITTTKPVPDKKQKGIWTARIISCDVNGQEVDLGFDPKNPDNMSSQPSLPKKTEKEVPELKVEKSESKSEPKSDKEFLLELEKQKEKNIDARARLVKEMKEAGAPWADIKEELKKLD